MVMSARRTYADAVTWVKSRRPPRVSSAAFAGKVFGGFYATGLLVFGVAAYFKPEDFGQPGSDALSLGWPTTVHIALVVVSAAVLAASARRIAWISNRVREPYDRALSEDPAYEGALNALAACPRPLQLRFALGWSWGPASAVCAAIVMAFSASYFTFYAVLSRGDVGLQTALLGGGNVIIGLLILAVAAPRLTTWRLATSVYRSATPRYLA